MFIDHQVAQKIADRAMKIIGHNINVMNHQGVIVGSGEPQRIDQVHEGALHVLNSKSEIDIHTQQASSLKGVKGGINLPVFCNGEMVGVVGITGDPDEVKKYADLVVMTAELMVEQAALTAQVQWDKRQKENVIVRLIKGELERDSLFDDRIERLDIDLNVPRVAVIIDVRASDTGHDLSLVTMQRLLRLLDSGDPDNLLAITKPTQIVILKKILLRNDSWDEPRTHRQLVEQCALLQKEPQLNFKIGLGQFFHAIEGLSLSYQSALQTLEAGRLSRPDQRLYNPKKLALDVMLKAALTTWGAEQLIGDYRRLIQKDKNGSLHKTLKAYFSQNASFGLTANQLNIHRNTLRYRLDKIDSILGMELHNLDDLMRLYLAFKMAGLANDNTKF